MRQNNIYLHAVGAKMPGQEPHSFFWKRHVSPTKNVYFQDKDLLFKEHTVLPFNLPLFYVDQRIFFLQCLFC